MIETTRLEVVTPFSILMERPVEMVVVPGVEGLFGVLPRHAPLLADLARGVVEVYEGGRIKDRFFIDGGIVDVSGESVVIMAERALHLDGIDMTILKERATNTEESEAEFLNAAAEYL